MKRVRVSRVEENVENSRDGYSYRRLVDHSKDVPFNFLKISVEDRHKARRVVAGIRNYFVVFGKGTFVVEDEMIEVGQGTLVTIWPKETYSYEGRMDLIEFNVATEEGIGHEDVE
ncbi:hypothetical protein H6785_03115 [Candidatus Nomurabacteria bacterium]|nr:hypothetical protein [Candidatus Nomurabacteria bacterium]